MQSKRGARVLGLSIGLMGLVLAAGCLTLTTTEGGAGGSSGASGAGSSGGSCNSVQDCPIITLCKTMACTNGTCVSGFVPAGVQCDDKDVCDGEGSCVECVENNDCSGDNAYCANHECISCSDGDRNGDETGIDCGGSNCKLCTGMPCTDGADCATGYCTDGVCCNATCTVECKACNVSGDEGKCTYLPAGQEDPGACDTTKACSGSFGGCKLKNGQPCLINNDCLSDQCSQNICAP